MKFNTIVFVTLVFSCFAQQSFAASEPRMACAFGLKDKPYTRTSHVSPEEMARFFANTREHFDGLIEDYGEIDRQLRFEHDAISAQRAVDPLSAEGQKIYNTLLRQMDISNKIQKSFEQRAIALNGSDVDEDFICTWKEGDRSSILSLLQDITHARGVAAGINTSGLVVEDRSTSGMEQPVKMSFYCLTEPVRFASFWYHFGWPLKDLLKKRIVVDREIYAEHKFDVPTLDALRGVLAHELVHWVHDDAIGDNLLLIWAKYKGVCKDDIQVKNLLNQWKRCQERRADMEAVVNADHSVDTAALKGLVQHISHGHLRNTQAEYIAHVNGWRTSSDDEHPSVPERISYLAKLYNASQHGTYISPGAVQRRIINCDDCRRSGGDFIIVAQDMARKAQQSQS